MLQAILRMILSLFGDKLANALRFEGYAYLLRKHGREAFDGIPGECPGWILPEYAGHLMEEGTMEEEKLEHTPIKLSKFDPMEYAKKKWAEEEDEEEWL